jgi:hypothetical protein
MNHSVRWRFPAAVPDCLLAGRVLVLEGGGEVGREMSQPRGSC